MVNDNVKRKNMSPQNPKWFMSVHAQPKFIQPTITDSLTISRNKIRFSKYVMRVITLK